MASFLKRNAWKISSVPEDDRHSSPMVQQEIGPETAPLKPKLKGITVDPANPKKWKIMGLDPSPELLAISMVYFVQGILGLARLAVTYFYKDYFQLDPGTVAVLTSFGAAPWVVKPIYGFLSDTVPIFGYKRRSYLILCGLCGALSWSAMATIVDSPTTATAAVILGSLGTACSDVVVDSIVVERSRDQGQDMAGSLQSLCWGSAAVGGVMSAYFSGSLVDAWGPRGVFAATAVFPLIVSVAALLISEKPTSLVPGAKVQLPAVEGLRASFLQQFGQLREAVTQRSIILPALFVFLWQATPTADTAMFFFETNKLGFTAEFLGRVRLAGALASLAGVATYNSLLKQVPLRRMFLWTACIGTVLGLTQLLLITGVNQQLGLSNELFVLGDSLVLTVLGQVSFMPVLVLAAQLCPEGVEATLFATLMSILNGGAFVGSSGGALLTKMFGVTSSNFDQLAPLVLLCTLSSLAPLPLLGLVPDTRPQEEYKLTDKDDE